MDVAQLSLDVSTVGGEVEWSTTCNAKSVVMPKSDALPKMAWQANQCIVIGKKAMCSIVPCHSIPCHNLYQVSQKLRLRSSAWSGDPPINIAGMKNRSIFRSTLFAISGLISCATSLTKANAASFSELSFLGLLALAMSWS